MNLILDPEREPRMAHPGSNPRARGVDFDDSAARLFSNTLAIVSQRADSNRPHTAKKLKPGYSTDEASAGPSGACV